MRLLVLCALCALAAPAAAQSGDVRRVILTDGTVVVGRIADEAADPLVVVSRAGVEQRVGRARVERIAPAVGGRFARGNPVGTRLLFAPTGRTLGQRGSVRVDVTSVFIANQVGATAAATDWLDVGASAAFALPILDASGFILTPGVKMQVVDTSLLDLAVGGTATFLVATGADLDTDGTVLGLPYVAATVGNEAFAGTAFVAVPVGGSVEDGDVRVGDGALVGLGAEVQLTSFLQVFSEVLLPTDGRSRGEFVGSSGARIFFRDRAALSLSVTGTEESDGALPLLGTSVRF